MIPIDALGGPGPPEQHSVQHLAYVRPFPSELFTTEMSGLCCVAVFPFVLLELIFAYYEKYF